jgi:hypothetical protein
MPVAKLLYMDYPSDDQRLSQLQSLRFLRIDKFVQLLHIFKPGERRKSWSPHHGQAQPQQGSRLHRKNYYYLTKQD